MYKIEALEGLKDIKEKLKEKEPLSREFFINESKFLEERYKNRKNIENLLKMSYKKLNKEFTI